MHRRVFIGSLTSGTLALAWIVRAQGARTVSRIGILTTAATSDMIGPDPAFRSGHQSQGGRDGCQREQIHRSPS